MRDPLVEMLLQSSTVGLGWVVLHHERCDCRLELLLHRQRSAHWRPGRQVVGERWRVSACVVVEKGKEPEQRTLWVG
jgi:hypothetical protein